MAVTYVAEITADTVSNKLAETPRGTASGCDARFAPITPKWGFKMYVSLIEAYYTFFRQRLLHYHSLAPAVGQQMEPIQIPFGEAGGCNSTRKSYGYIVERVRIAEDYTPDGWDSDSLRGAGEDLSLRMENALGKGDCDLHPKNIGFDDYDNLVVVDCGQGTTKHCVDDIKELRLQLKELGLWRGDKKEYAAWGKALAVTDGRNNWNLCECEECRVERKRLDDVLWGQIALEPGENEKPITGCQCKECKRIRGEV